MRDRRGTQAVSPVLLGVDDSGWVPVTAGESGATVFRSADATRYAKCVPAADAADLKAERDRVAWLSGQGVPGPRVLDWQSGDAGACLVTGAVSGVPLIRYLLRTSGSPGNASRTPSADCTGHPCSGAPSAEGWTPWSP